MDRLAAPRAKTSGLPAPRLIIAHPPPSRRVSTTLITLRSTSLSAAVHGVKRTPCLGEQTEMLRCEFGSDGPIAAINPGNVRLGIH